MLSTWADATAKIQKATAKNFILVQFLDYAYITLGHTFDTRWNYLLLFILLKVKSLEMKKTPLEIKTLIFYFFTYLHKKLNNAFVDRFSTIIFSMVRGHFCYGFPWLLRLLQCSLQVLDKDKENLLGSVKYAN